MIAALEPWAAAPSYNLRVVVLGVATLGVTTGVLGCFLLFRRRSLLSDALGHATLPGVALAFLLAARLGPGGKPFLALMCGALVTGWIALRAVHFLGRRTRIREDAALACVLSASYGLGVVWLSVVQNLELPHASGLESSIYGMAASLLLSESVALAGISIATLVGVGLLFKELNALSFDEGFVSAHGLPHRWLDELLMVACLLVTIAGIQAVGLLLVTAMFVIPAATARLYARSLRGTLVIAGAVGAAGSVGGAIASATVQRLPAGAAIILALGGLFFLSLVLAPRRGLAFTKASAALRRRRTENGQLLRALLAAEGAQQLALLHEHRVGSSVDASPAQALRDWGWAPQRVERAVRRLTRSGDLLPTNADRVQLSYQGWQRAVRAERTHRLTQLLLAKRPDVARDALLAPVDEIEEIAPAGVAAELRRTLELQLEAELRLGRTATGR
ncbi:MAG: metal ABC transporter permease [Planctomycetota bacterium]